MHPAIVAFGEPLMEFSQQPAEERRPLYLAGYGGDTGNTAVAAARQGVGSGYLSAVGADSFGDDFLELWRREGVDTRHVRRDDSAPTGIYFISYGESGHRFSYRRAGSAASRLGPADVPEDYLAGAQILHVSAISQAISTAMCDAVFHAMAVARRNGVAVSYDTNLRTSLWPLARARAVIHAAVAEADIVLPSLDDSRELTGLAEPDTIVDFYQDLGVPLVVLKLGAEGVLVATPEERQRIPGFSVETVDATGAGDTFGGSFLARRVLGDEPLAAARYANAAAALSTRGYGAINPIPRREAVEAFLAGESAR